jgi:uncharacterized protein with PQ loop repeat
MPYIFAYNPDYDDTVAVFAVALSFLALLQVYSLISTRVPHPEAHRAVSLVMWMFSVTSNIMWLFYGIMYRSYTLVVSSVLAGIWAGWVVLFLVKYRYMDEDGYKDVDDS